MNIFKATLDTRHQNGVIGNVTQFDHATLELQILSDGQVGEAWESPEFELIAMKRDMNSVREVDQDRFTILSKEEHKVQIELKEQFLTCRGTVKMQLVIKEGSRLSTTLFYLVIGQSLDHDIVASYRDAKVLDDLDSLNQQAYDDLAFREQRYEEMEDSFTELNGKMNANEAERNAAETKRSQIFETNETNRARTFNNQVEEQGVAFSNAQTQRDESFIESQQNMSQEFEKSQRERENAFNELQKSNQKTFETNEQKRQMTFAQSQSANKQTFTQNETERQHIFESNESDRQVSESQRVQNESERVQAESQRADAEVIRQQKMTEFEEKATQLSEDLDSQVARVGEFVSANEEKLLGPHDKTDYMGNAHKSVKDANDANVEYILGEVNTVHYEGQHITATDTIEKQVRSAILLGQTLVNLFEEVERQTEVDKAYRFFKVIGNQVPTLKPNTKYTLIFDKYVEGVSTVIYKTHSASLMTDFYTFGKSFCFTTIEDVGTEFHIFIKGNTVEIAEQMLKLNPKIVILEGDYTNVDIPYFEGMQSVKMPVLTTIGKNLFDGELSDGYLNETTGKFEVSTSNKITNYINVTPSSYLSVHFNNTRHGKIFEYDINKNYIKASSQTTNGGVVLSEQTKYVRVRLPKEVVQEALQMEENNQLTPYEPHKTNILSTPSGLILGGVGDAQDTLDLLTGEVVEGTKEIVLDGSENWRFNSGELSSTKRFMLSSTGLPLPLNETKGMCDRYNYKYVYSADEKGVFISKTGAVFIREELSLSLDELKNKLKNNPITIRYPLAEKVIKTVDLSGQKVYSYDRTTHYSCSAAEGALVPTLSIDVPTNLPALVSRQRTTIESQKEQIITLEQENEQLIAQNEVQDIDISLNQDAINFMLFAPATMSVNNESRNNEGVNTMAAYLANQILKGKLDYTLVVSRYGSYKEDIDTILITEGKQDLIK